MIAIDYVALVGEQGKCSGESASSSPMWSEFNSSPVPYVG